MAYTAEQLERIRAAEEAAAAAAGASGSMGTSSEGGPLIGPEFLGGLFPSAATIPDYKKIKTNLKKFNIPGAGYSFVDPLKFSESFGDFTAKALEKSYAQAKAFGLDAVESELQGLLNYVPRASELKRSEVDKDNLFNQEQRTRQINSTIPDVVSDLNTVASNARAYSEGRLPDSIQDRALELGLRSSAADQAYAGGFGVRSSAARKLSDLVSADKRFAISQFGNQLLGQSAAQRADLFLAPTQYSNAGAEISVKPTDTAAKITAGYFSEINNRTMLDPSTAFTSAINQSQFYSSMQQRTQEFNANMRADLTKFNRNMRFNTNSFNANAKNEFALSYFNYLSTFANATAGVANANTNLGIMLDQQKKAEDAYKESKGNTQGANEAGSIASGIAEILGSGGQIVKGVTSILDWFT